MSTVLGFDQVRDLCGTARFNRWAGMEVLKRIKKNTVEQRLLNSRGLPNFGINFYILNAKGEFAGVTMYEGSSFALCNENGPQTLKSDALLPGKPGETD